MPKGHKDIIKWILLNLKQLMLKMKQLMLVEGNKSTPGLQQVKTNKKAMKPNMNLQGFSPLKTGERTLSYKNRVIRYPV